MRKHIPASIYLIILSLIFLSSTLVSADYPILSRHISLYNLEIHKKSLSDDSYRGEEGILLIRPDVAIALGINAYIDLDYQDSKMLYEKAEKSLVTAKNAMASRRKEQYPGEYSEIIMDSFLSHKEEMESAKEKLMAYRGRISQDNDERLNEALCYEIMEKILAEGLEKNEYRLRDALGYFFNKCHGNSNNTDPLTPENVRFVNHIFNAFEKEASDEDKELLCLDKDYDYADKAQSLDWKKLAGDDITQIIKELEIVLEQTREENENIDPLLFIALMKRESLFDPNAVSYVGAAGLTQIMPQTAKEMGMENIHMPGYFYEAMGLLKEERNSRREAMDALFNIDRDNGMIYAERARKFMQRSLEFKEKREHLLAKYRSELMGMNKDDRFKPVLSMSYGLKYFSEMMRKQDGDISLALSSYNAGPHRVMEYGGIPPFEETVTFRNQVLRYYREYLEKAE